MLAFLAATTPLFFDIYRTAAFNTVPHDDYSRYLLTLVGQANQVPGAPWAYRIISVAVAIPFYYVLSPYEFSNLSNVDLFRLRAVQALSFSSYLSLVLTAVTIYAISRRRFFATRAASLIVALQTFVLCNFTTLVAVDPFAILVISLLLLWLDTPLLFVPLILTSIGINEKIPIIFATILIFRNVISIARHRRFILCAQLFSACVAVAGYFAMTHFIDIPGNENQTNPAVFLTNLQSALAYTVSLKGLFLSGLPIVILIMLFLFSVLSQHQGSFHASDVSALFVLVLLALIADVRYNVGRVAMYSYPLFLPAAACLIDDVLNLKDAPTA